MATTKERVAKPVKAAQQAATTSLGKCIVIPMTILASPEPIKKYPRS